MMRQILFTLALSGLGAAGNLVPVPLLSGAELVFGPIAALLALLWLGSGAALVVTLASGVSTLVLWGHPYALVILGGEIAAIAWVRERALRHERTPLPLAVSSALYWLLIGIPLIVLCYRFALHLDWSQTLRVALTRALNGILDALLAALIALCISWLRQTRASLRVSEVLFNIVLGTALLPAVLMASWNHHHLHSRLEAVMEQQLSRVLERAIATDSALDALRETLALMLPPGSNPRPYRLPSQETPPVPLDGHLHRLLATTQPQSRYWLARACAHGSGCQGLAISISTRAIDAQLQAATIRTLTLLLGLALSAVLIAGLLSHRLAHIFRALITCARALPVYADNAQGWRQPDTGLLLEVETLAGILSEVARSLGTSFQTLEQEREHNREALEALGQNDLRYRLVVEHLEDLLIRTDVLDRIEFVSPSFCQFFEIEEQELLGEHFSPLIHPLDQAVTNAARALLFQPPYRCQFEHRVRGVSGWRWLQWSQRAMLNDQGEMVAIVALGRDITERKAAEDQLCAERQRLANVIEGTHLGTWEWHPRTGQLVVNARWLEICGYSRAELDPLDIEAWRRLIHPDDRELSLVLLEHHMQGHSERYECELRIRHKDGHWVWVHDQGRIVRRDAEGQALLIAGTDSDISERQYALQQLAASERRLRTILDHAPTGILILNDTRHLDYANASFATLLGHTPAQLAGSAIDTLIHPHDQVRDAAWFSELFSGQRNAYRTQMRYLHPDGHTLWGDLRMVLLPAEENQAPQAIGMVADITDLMQATAEREALEAQLRRYSGELEALIDLSAEQRDGDEIAALLRFACRYLGMEAATLSLGQAQHARVLASAILEPDSLLNEARLQQWHARMLSDETCDLPLDSLTPWQHRLILGDSGDSEGVIMGLSYIPRDLGEGSEHERLLLWNRHPRLALERTEQQLLRLIAQNIRAARYDSLVRQRLIDASEREAIGHLASGIAHDFNNLLGVFEANLHYLGALLLPEQDEAPLAAALIPEVTEVLEETRGALHHARVTTSGMLSLNRTGQIPLTPVALDELGEELGKLLAQLMPSTVRAQIEVTAGLCAQTHAPFLLAVLLNLALNARDAMPEGGVLEMRAQHARSAAQIPVRLGQCPAGAHAEIRVSDQGHGMSAEAIECIFEPFFSTKGRGRGHGLGLFMVQEFILRTGAGLSVQSQPGIGTEFRLLLALDTGCQRDEESGNLIDAPLLEQQRRLLVVDDDPEVRRSLTRLLQQAGFEVLNARDGREALACLSADDSIALVLSDIDMPHLDGLALAKALARDYPALPVVLMTGRRDALMPSDEPLPTILSKPLDADVLLKHINDSVRSTVEAASSCENSALSARG